MDRLTREQRHRNMSHIRSKDTSIECILRRELRKRGYGYRKNYKALPGKPDIVLTKYKICVFCDSEFFHGKNWEKQKERICSGSNSDYWINKIERNIERDAKIDMELLHLGWIVLHFWGDDIKKDVNTCVNEIEDAIIERKTEYI